MIDMITKKMKLALVFLGVLILVSVPVPAMFIAVLLGLLLIPLMVFAAVLITGIPVIVKEIQAVIESGKEMFVISLSKESIILETNLKDNF